LDRNDDQFLIAEISKSLQVMKSTLPLDDRTPLSISTGAHLFVVADGLGRIADGHLANDRATFTAVQYVLALLPWFFGAAGRPEVETKAELLRALDKCELLLPAAGASRIKELSPGTTVTMAYLLWPDLFVVHLGDSRCYVQRGSGLHQVSRDQSELQRLHREGNYEHETKNRSGLSTILWRAFGRVDEPILPEVYHVMVAAGDTILVCTDGLSRFVGDDQIAAALSAEGSARHKCDSLIEAANRASGADNITVVVSQLLDEQPSESATR
jgi:protein phosphatase